MKRAAAAAPASLAEGRNVGGAEEFRVGSREFDGKGCCRLVFYLTLSPQTNQVDGCHGDTVSVCLVPRRYVEPRCSCQRQSSAGVPALAVS